MTGQRLRQVEEIFSRIVELSPADRAAALDEACGSDGELRAEVQSLLRHADEDGDFLEKPALGAGFDVGRGLAAADDFTGRLLGPYRVLRRIGSGGMGTIYLASRADGQFEQHVAIKVVKRGMDSEEILSRFVQERRTLATLNHPNIARLFDGGITGEGRPYLVMEYVRGEPIHQYCDAQRLATAARLRLFCAVCDAVRFAHQKLVVHRDLKPGNMLVDEAGVPKLLDFGIAKVLEGTGSLLVTAAHERRFTPEYASPEQVAGQPLGTTTDIYSLGVVLYELLTGQRPYTFDSRSTSEIERVVCAREPLPPSIAVERGTGSAAVNVEQLSRVREGSPHRLRRRLSGDLDTIVMKAMHKDPARRYASVDQFVGDIERHLEGLPVLARPDTLAYRLRTYARRHKVGMSFAVAAVLLLVGGASMSLWQASVARQQRDAAYLARDQAEASAEFLQRMLAAVDPANEGPDATVRAVLEEAALRVEAELRDRPLLQASIRSTIGRSYLGLGLLPQAKQHVETAYQMRTQLLDPGHHDIAESEFDLAKVLYALGDYAEAEALLDQSLATHRRLRGEENLDTARVWNDLGAVRKAAGKIAGAEEAYRRALAIRDKLAGRESLDAAESLNNLAGVMQARGQHEEAEASLRQVLEVRRRLLRANHPLVLQSMANLGVVLAMQGETIEAERLLRQAVESDREVYGAAHPALATDLSGLGRLLALQKRFAEAEPLLQEALVIRRKLLSPGDDRLLKTAATLSDCLVGLGRDQEAESVLVETLEQARAEIDPASKSWETIFESLDAIYQRAGDSRKQAELRSMRAGLVRGSSS